jgi:acetoin utilization deacetylase AcuC-like enzyme
MKNLNSQPTLTAIPVFYRPEMVAPNVGATSPSAAKPAQAVADWQEHGLPIELSDFPSVTEAQIKAAHHEFYVDRVMHGLIANGFGTVDAAVNASLPFTSGSMLAAARAALANGAVACAPCSGFHHAGYATGGGFCTFNGLMITALALKAEGLVNKVAILDLDQHFGDGTQDIMGQLKLSTWVKHLGVGPMEKQADEAERYLKRLPELVEGLKAYDLLLYQAGADAHINDPLGGWMTSDQLRRRDRIVFACAKRIGLPVAWNLAGGYQRDESGGIEPVLAIHRETMKACAQVHVDQQGA